MNQITTTQLRTHSSALIEALLAGKSIELIHRSKKLGVISLSKTSEHHTDYKRLIKNVKALNFPFISYANREKMYRKHLMEKYGQGLS
jgi:hypothetical protein